MVQALFNTCSKDSLAQLYYGDYCTLLPIALF